MRKINIETLEREICQNGTNFVAFIQTPWHAHGVDAFIKYKEAQGVRLKGLICVRIHPQAGLLLQESSFSYNNNSIEVVEFDDTNNTSKQSGLIEKIRSHFDSSSELFPNKQFDGEFYILKSRVPAYQWHLFVAHHTQMRPISVLIDEGLGMYMRTSQDWLALVWNGRGLNRVGSLYYYLIGHKLKDKALKEHHALIEFTLFSRDGMKPNQDVIDWYRLILNDGATTCDTRSCSLYEDAVVINTQPYFDEGQIENNEDLELINQVCRLCKDKGLRVVLKPHPREKSIGRYDAIENCIVDTNAALSQESIIASCKVKPRILLGLSSTTLVSLNLFYGIKTVSLVRCMPCNKLGKMMRTDLSRFEKTFSNTVCSPRNLQELGDVLETIA